LMLWNINEQHDLGKCLYFWHLFFPTDIVFAPKDVSGSPPF
jgi:hypothetical protein